MEPSSQQTLAWEPYSFYRDRFKPFESDNADTCIIVGLFRDGTYRFLYPIIDGDGLMRIGIPFRDAGPYGMRIKQQGLSPNAHQFTLVDIANPFDIVAIAKAHLPLSGIQFLDKKVRRSYVLTEQPLAHEIDDMECPLPFGSVFDPALDHGEHVLRQEQVNCLLHSQYSPGRGTPFHFVDGLLEFLDGDILSEKLDDLDCYAAHGIIAESHEHIFIGIAKRATFIEFAKQAANQEAAKRDRSAQRREDKRRRKEAETQLFASGWRFNPADAYSEFNRRNLEGALEPFRTEFDDYIANIENTRFARAVVSLIANNNRISLLFAVASTQDELMRHAIKKVIGYAAAAEKASLP